MSPLPPDSKSVLIYRLMNLYAKLSAQEGWYVDANIVAHAIDELQGEPLSKEQEDYLEKALKMRDQCATRT